MKRRPTWKATDIDGPQQLEECDPMLGVLGEVLVDHHQRGLEDVLHDDGHFILH